mmetsp:Transcript_105732/g.170176  ORF Transcript_105732/g.170176 Transcript_105732/m.170176 type:complete len:222 (+) Transcript_105732:2199-2864(+)
MRTFCALQCSLSARSVSASSDVKCDCWTAARIESAPTCRSFLLACWCSCVSRTSYTSISARPGRGAHWRMRSSNCTVSDSCSSLTTASVSESTSTSCSDLYSSSARRCVRRTAMSELTGISSTSSSGSLPHAENGLCGDTMGSDTYLGSLTIGSPFSSSSSSSSAGASGSGSGSPCAARISSASASASSLSRFSSSISTSSLWGMTRIPTRWCACCGCMTS